MFIVAMHLTVLVIFFHTLYYIKGSVAVQVRNFVVRSFTWYLI